MDLDKVNFFFQEIHRGSLQMSPHLLQLSHHLRGGREEAELLRAWAESGHPHQRLPQCQFRLRSLSREDGVPELRQGQGGSRRHHQAVRGLQGDSGTDRFVPGGWGVSGDCRPTDPEGS